MIPKNNAWPLSGVWGDENTPNIAWTPLPPERPLYFYQVWVPAVLLSIPDDLGKVTRPSSPGRAVERRNIEGRTVPYHTARGFAYSNAPVCELPLVRMYVHREGDAEVIVRNQVMRDGIVEAMKPPYQTAIVREHDTITIDISVQSVEAIHCIAPVEKVLAEVGVLQVDTSVNYAEAVGLKQDVVIEHVETSGLSVDVGAKEASVINLVAGFEVDCNEGSMLQVATGLHSVEVSTLKTETSIEHDETSGLSQNISMISARRIDLELCVYADCNETSTLTTDVSMTAATVTSLETEIGIICNELSSLQVGMGIKRAEPISLKLETGYELDEASGLGIDVAVRQVEAVALAELVTIDYSETSGLGVDVAVRQAGVESLITQVGIEHDEVSKLRVDTGVRQAGVESLTTQVGIEHDEVSKLRVDTGVRQAGVESLTTQVGIEHDEVSKLRVDTGVRQAGVESLTSESVIEYYESTKLAADVSVKVVDAVSLVQATEITIGDGSARVDSSVGSVSLTDAPLIEPGSPDEMIFGASWDKGPDPTLTRIGDAVGLVANAGVDDEVVVNDFDEQPIWGEMGEVTDVHGNVFVRIPKLYIRKVDTEGYKSWEVSKTKHGEDWYLPWCFWDFTNEVELPYVDVGKYEGSLSADNRLESKADMVVIQYKSFPNYRIWAGNNGSGYQLLDIHVLDMLQVLFYIEFATLDSQSIMRGYTGVKDGTSYSITLAGSNTNKILVSSSTVENFRAGEYINIGTSSGKSDIAQSRRITQISGKWIYFDGEPVNVEQFNNISHALTRTGSTDMVTASSGSLNSSTSGYGNCMYRGIENPWGNSKKHIDGVNCNYESMGTNGTVWVCLDASQYAYNVFAVPYEATGYILASSHGMIMQKGYDSNLPFAEFPVLTGGTDYLTYYADQFTPSSSSGARVAVVGDEYTSTGLTDGINRMSLNAYSDSLDRMTVRLVRKAL